MGDRIFDSYIFPIFFVANNVFWNAPTFPCNSRLQSRLAQHCLSLSGARAVHAHVGSTCLGNSGTLGSQVVRDTDRRAVLFLTSPLPETTEAAAICKSIWNPPSLGKSSKLSLVDFGITLTLPWLGSPSPRLSSGKEVLESFHDASSDLQVSRDQTACFVGATEKGSQPRVLRTA